jgi:glutamyl-tRNA reductase
MTFFAFGINFKTASLPIREAFALSEEAKRNVYRSLILSESAEIILLSTCNRTEVYLFGAESDVQVVKEALANATGQVWQEEQAFLYQDEEAVRHVLQLTSGLRSLVIGDAQILNQVKDAYQIAVDEDRVGAVLHRLIHSAFRAAKRVAHETNILLGSASISSAAVAMARSDFERRGRNGLTGSRVLLLGTGQMGRLAVQALSRFDLGSLSVANRSQERAQALAETTGAGLVSWESRHDAAAAADLVIVATGAAEPVLHADRLPSKYTETLVIDVAVPRNVDPALDTHPGYRVLELDALQEWVSKVERTRRADIPDAERIVEEQLAEFVAWMFHQQALHPAVQAIRETFESIRLQEIERHHHRFSNIDREELDVLTRSIMQKLLAIPVVRLKSVDRDSLDFVRGIRLLQMLFSRPGCDDSAAPADGKHAHEEQASCGAVSREACPFERAVAEGSSDSLQALIPLLESYRSAQSDQGLA